MNWQTAIDIYCERTDASLWSEPVNFATNLSFIFAAAWCHRQISKHVELQKLSFRILIVLVYCIGVGSALFHSVATRWAQAADVIPIGLFLFAYIGFYGNVLARFSLSKQLGLFVLFIGLTVGLASIVPAKVVNGSNIYFGSYAMLGWFAWHCHATGHGPWRLYLVASLIFVASLFFRSIDMRTCAAFPLGTHFLWHILNGAVIFLVLLAAIRWLRAASRHGV